jgi:hypothetical protein
MSSPHRPLTSWSNLPVLPPEPAATAHTLTNTIIIIALALVCFYTLFPQKTMDLLDAYMELPYLSSIF